MDHVSKYSFLRPDDGGNYDEVIKIVDHVVVVVASAASTPKGVARRPARPIAARNDDVAIFASDQLLNG